MTIMSYAAFYLIGLCLGVIVGACVVLLEECPDPRHCLCGYVLLIGSIGVACLCWIIVSTGSEVAMRAGESAGPAQAYLCWEGKALAIVWGTVWFGCLFTSSLLLWGAVRHLTIDTAMFTGWVFGLWG